MGTKSDVFGVAAEAGKRFISVCGGSGGVLCFFTFLQSSVWHIAGTHTGSHLIWSALGGFLWFFSILWKLPGWHGRCGWECLPSDVECSGQHVSCVVLL